MAEHSNPFATSPDDSSFQEEPDLVDVPKAPVQRPVSGSNPFAVQQVDGADEQLPVKVKRPKSAYKSRGVALILLFVTGVLGGHNYYVGRYGAGVAQLALFGICQALNGGFFNFVLGAWLFFWLCKDFFAICARDIGDLTPQ